MTDDVVAFALVLVMAGSGERLGSPVPKAFVQLAGRPLWRHSFEAFTALDGLRRVVLVAPESYVAQVFDLVRDDPRVGVVSGGPTRQQSVAFGLIALGAEDPGDGVEVVAIHDAARPLIRSGTAARVIAAAAESGAAIAAIRARDTIKEVGEGDRIAATRDRSSLWQAQTPQCFRPGDILRLHREAAARGLEVTDDAALAEAMEMEVRVVESDAWNFKITTADDLAAAEALLAARGGGVE